MSPNGRRLLAVAALLVAAGAPAGCAGKLPPCPAAGGPAWRELESAHFRLRTDDDSEAARAALRDLEQFQAALLTVFHAAPELRIGRLPVVVVRDGWDAFADEQMLGWFTRALFRPLVVMRADSELARQEVIKHELVHYFSAKVMPAQPPWLAEGLATFFETLDVDTGKGEVLVGRPAPNLLSIVQHGARLPLTELIAAKTIEGDRSVFYASAWATVHFLMNHHADELRAYEAALRMRVPFDAAWTQAFGKLTLADLDGELRDYFDGGQYTMLGFPFTPAPATPIVERPLPDAEVHTTRALLLLSGKRSRWAEADHQAEVQEDLARARREVDEALRLDPANVAARAIAHFGLHGPVELEAAKRATETAPGDWMAWLLLSEALRERHMRAQSDAARKAVELAFDDPSVTLTLIETPDRAKKP
jgi:hypothetical protein